MKKNKYGINCHDEETIIAQCTPSGSGAIALLRLSGVDAVSIVDRMSKLESGKKLKKQPSHTIHYGSVFDVSGKKIDKVLFFLMFGPKTFTGQDTVEITVHNNPFIISDIIEKALFEGARLSQEGEFSKRAFLNNKIDLSQAEAINDLIHAQTQAALKASLSQLEGSFSNKIKKIEEQLLNAFSFSEASFEFVEDENLDFDEQILKIIQNVEKEIIFLKEQFNQRKHIKEGVRIALLGSVNAGKSSLFNILLKQERAIVTNVPGTTRDVIEASLYKYGIHQTIIDTAGLRKTSDAIEKEGILRAFVEAEKSDILLLVFDGSKKITKLEKNIYYDLIQKYSDKIILVKSKIDYLKQIENQFSDIKIVSVSSKTQKNINQLQECIKEKIKQLFSNISSPFLVNKRQYNLLLSVEKKLQSLLTILFNKSPQYELISIHLQEIISTLSGFSGKTVSKKAVDQIFKKFCIGK